MNENSLNKFHRSAASQPLCLLAIRYEFTEIDACYDSEDTRELCQGEESLASLIYLRA